jgi:hypothetical protein
MTIADPLSITASVVGIATAALQSTQFLVKTINNIKDAPGTIKDLSAIPGEELNISKDISGVSADNRGFVIVGVANDIDIKDLCPW